MMSIIGYLRKGAIFKTCLNCGVVFGVQPFRKKTARYCSKLCGFASLERSKKISKSKTGKSVISDDGRRRLSDCQKLRVGERNSNWKGGTTPIATLVRKMDRYNQWRASIFARDKWTCRDCGKQSAGDIEAHHLVKFALLMSRFSVKTIEQARECEALWDTENGVTLCVKCHEKTDTFRAAGQNGNTKPTVGIGKLKSGKWIARICANGNGKRLYLGLFQSPEEAKKAYDEAAVKLYGMNAVTNAKT